MNTVRVMLWGTCVGYVSQDNPWDFPVFAYDKDFVRRGIEISPIVAPLSERNYVFPTLNEESFYKLPGLLSASLPDRFGNSLIKAYLSSQGRDLADLTAVEKLLYTGKRGMGALEYEPAQSLYDIPDASIDLNALAKLASDILSKREDIHIKDDEGAMAQLLKIGTSAGGARAKALIAWNKNTGDIRSGQILAGEGYEYWLVKFDGIENNHDHNDKPDPDAYTRIEQAYYHMAINAGIVMNECCLYEEAGSYHFMTKRFDRSESGDKFHMQSLGAIAHYDFNSPGENSYEQAANIINRLNIGQDAVEQLFRRMVFNCMSRNNDDHVKNISFLMDRNGKWSLSPAYDITYAYQPDSKWLRRHQMQINGKLDNIGYKDIKNTAAMMNISGNKADKIIDEIGRSVANWMSYAEQCYVPENKADFIKNKHLGVDDLWRITRQNVGFTPTVTKNTKESLVNKQVNGGNHATRE